MDGTTVGSSDLTLNLRPFTVRGTAPQQRAHFPPHSLLPASTGTAFSESVMSALSILKLSPASLHGFSVATQSHGAVIIAVLDKFQPRHLGHLYLPSASGLLSWGKEHLYQAQDEVGSESLGS